MRNAAVTLSRKVDNRQADSVAVGTARSAPGVTNVVDQMTIG